MANGVYLQTLNTEKFNGETFFITFTKPISEVSPEKMAILPYILVAGSKDFPSAKILQRKLGSLFGASIEPLVRKKGEFLSISLACKFITGEFTGKIDILKEIYSLACEILFNPLINDDGFSEEILKNEKINLVNRINGIKNDKRVYANTRMFEIMCKNEPYSLNRFGEVSNAEKIDAKDLYQAYLDIISTSQVDICYIGAGDINSLDFSKFTERKEMNYETKTDFKVQNVKEVIEVLDISQGKLSIGLRTNTVATDSDYPALILMNTLFGASTSSKLFVNIREKMSLCYYASSNVEKIKGVMSINSGIEIENFEIAKTAILKEFDDVKQGNFTEDDIKSAKLTVINSLRTMKDTSYSLEEYYFSDKLSNSDTNIDELIEAIEKVSKHEIMDVSSKIVLDTIYFLKGEQV